MNTHAYFMVFSLVTLRLATGNILSATCSGLMDSLGTVLLSVKIDTLLSSTAFFGASCN